MSFQNNVLTVTKIFWKRSYLFIEYDSMNQRELGLSKGGQVIVMEQKQLEENHYRAKLNICIAQGREMLPDGCWTLWTDAQGILFADEVLEHIEVISNVFRYDKDKAYIVTFHLEELENKLNLLMKIDYMRKNKKPKLRMDKLFLVKGAMNIWYQCVRFFAPKKGNRILFMSENRAEMTGNLKAIYDRMIERKMNRDYVLNLSFRNIFAKRQNPLDWVKTVTKLALHDYIFVEDYVPVFGFIHLDKKTTLVQTWHAGFGFKSVGYGRFGLEGSPNPYHSCHRKYTYGLIGNEHLKEIYSEVFGIEKEALLATGMPRLSHFLDQDYMEKTRETLYRDFPEIKGKRVITFAPTYRGSNQKDAYYDMDRIDQKEFARLCKETNSIVLCKFHPFLKGRQMLDPAYSTYLKDVTEYNLNDLFYVTDVLITDYSSCFYDYLLLGRPVLFYIYDEMSYSATRGVHRPVSKIAPGTVCRSFEDILLSLRENKYEEAVVPEFMVDNAVKNGTYTASDRVIDYIILKKRDIEV